jgi:hypothetical protein
MSEWLCENCYNELCKLKNVQDIEVCTIANNFGVKCVICDKIAEHLTCITKEDFILLFKLKISKAVAELFNELKLVVK